MPATEGVTRIVEGVHQSVWSTLGVSGAAPGQTRGITGWVYKSIHTVTRLAGHGVETILAGLEPLLESVEDAEPGTPQREAFLAALNGVMGDRLVADRNPLATPMTLIDRGKEPTSKLLLLIHGLCRNDLQWRTEREEKVLDHGEGLASALGYTPVYLRYNSGLHTWQNGRELAALLESLVDDWPVPMEEISIVAHSMGGLVARSAAHYAQQESLRWPKHLKKMIFLGTPHRGAPLEQAGHWLDLILGTTRYTVPFTKLSGLRSVGINDLRCGSVIEVPGTAPLPEGVECLNVAAMLAAEPGTSADRLVGDGLVPVPSALGDGGAQWRVASTSHMDLLSSPAVHRRMVQWLAVR